MDDIEMAGAAQWADQAAAQRLADEHNAAGPPSLRWTVEKDEAGGFTVVMRTVEPPYPPAGG